MQQGARGMLTNEVRQSREAGEQGAKSKEKKINHSVALS